MKKIKPEKKLKYRVVPIKPLIENDDTKNITNQIIEILEKREADKKEVTLKDLAEETNLPIEEIKQGIKILKKKGRLKNIDERNLRHRDGSAGFGFYTDFQMTVNGKKRRVRAFAGYNIEEARNELIRLRMEKIEEKRGLKKQIENVLFSDFADEFIEKYSKVNKKSAARDEFSVAHLKKFKDFKKRCLNEISPEHVEGYKAHRKSEGAAPATINRELACLKTCLNKACEWGRLESNPIARVKKFKEFPAKERFLSDEEIKKLLAVSKPHLRSILIVALNTGMRKGEILGLKWENVDFRKGFIYVGALDSKSGRSRTIPMSSLVFETLDGLRFGAASEFVFMNPETGKKFRDITTSFKTACRDAEIDGMRIHDLRHTALWRMIKAGIDIVTVSKIAGHSSILMTRRYCHPMEEDMRLAVEKMADIIAGRRQEVAKLEIPKPAKDLKRYL